MKEIITIPCVIPARYASSRFPGKPLEMISGKAMIERVYENAVAAKYADPVIVATDDERIYNYCQEKGMRVMYTSPDCDNGSVRVAEIAKDMDSPFYFELQGDQPIVYAEIIDDFLSKATELVSNNPSIDIVQPYSPITKDQRDDVDVVKVAVSNSGRFLTFSRKPLDTGYRTLGLYLWKREALLNFPNLELSDYEKSETTHLVRFVMNDLYVQGVQIDDTNWVEVDRPEHIPQIEKIIEAQGRV